MSVHSLPANLFVLAGNGTSSNFIYDYKDSDYSSGEGWIHFEMPLAEYFDSSDYGTDIFNYLTFGQNTSWSDSGTNSRESYFRNVKIISPEGDILETIDFNSYTVGTYVATQDWQNQTYNEPTVTILDDGATVKLTGDAWKKLTRSTQIVEEWVVVNTESFYNNAEPSTLAHTTHYTYDANGNLETITDAEGNVTTYTYDALGRKTKEKTYQYVDFNDRTITAYDSASGVLDGQYGQPLSVSVQDNGRTFKLEGNTAKKIDFDATITSDTFLVFDFKSDSEGEIHAIGLDENDDYNDLKRLFKLYGTQIVSDTEFTSLTSYSADGEWVHYEIPIGQYYTGQMNYMTFINDDDNSDGGNAVLTIDQLGNSYYKNVRLVSGASRTYDYDANGNLVECTDRKRPCDRVRLRCP